MDDEDFSSGYMAIDPSFKVASAMFNNEIAGPGTWV